MSTPSNTFYNVRNEEIMYVDKTAFQFFVSIMVLAFVYATVSMLIRILQSCRAKRTLVGIVLDRLHVIVKTFLDTVFAVLCFGAGVAAARECTLDSCDQAKKVWGGVALAFILSNLFLLTSVSAWSSYFNLAAHQVRPLALLPSC